jgi:hypothetical protein
MVFQTSKARPRQSYPGPRFAVVAGALTRTIVIRIFLAGPDLEIVPVLSPHVQRRRGHETDSTLTSNRELARRETMDIVVDNYRLTEGQRRWTAAQNVMEN